MIECLNIALYKDVAVGEKIIVEIKENEGQLLKFHVPHSLQLEEDNHNWSVYVERVDPPSNVSAESFGLSQADVTISDGEKSTSFKIPNIWLNNDKNVILETKRRRLKICLEKDVLHNSTLEVLLSTRSKLPVRILVDVELSKKWSKSEAINGKIIENETLSVSQPVIKYFHTPSI